MVKRKIADAIKEYLESSGIKQTFIVEKTGIPSNTLSDILNNKRRLLADEFIKIISVLEVDANYFVDCINNQKLTNEKEE